MAKNTDLAADVLVLGDHPSAYLSAALLAHKSKLSVAHAALPEQHIADRLVLVNPAIFSLHPLLEPLRRKLDLHGIYGVRFLADEPPTASEHRSKSALSAVGSLKELRSAAEGVARAEGVHFLTPRGLAIQRIDEAGLVFANGKQTIRATAMVLGGRLSVEQEKFLGLNDEVERGVMHRYSYVRLKASRQIDVGSRPLMPMSLDLRGKLACAWLLPGSRGFQLAVETPLEKFPPDPCELLRHWAVVLRRHGVCKTELAFEPSDIHSIDIPFAGALAQEGVANRTILVGPAGGFYAATSEDAYPNCWSALFAADVLKKSLKETHLQDAIQIYRQKWRTTLGDYLRGPQMDLRFLLPLVYRNQEMASRLAEAILVGKSIVR